jgi:hypothetical protein
MRHVLTLLLTVVLLALASPACRRTPSPVIVGRVTDNFNRPIAGATVSIRDTAFRVQTDARGEFSLPFTPGSFHLAIEAPGCLAWERDISPFNVCSQC